MILRLRENPQKILILFWFFYFSVFIFSYSSLGANSPIVSYSDLVKEANSLDNPYFRLRYFASAASFFPVLLVSPRSLLRSPCTIFILCSSLLGIFLFANTGSFLVAISAPVAAISAFSLASTLQYLQAKKICIILPFSVLFTLPAIGALILGLNEFVYNTYYGRARLLLGFVHPKEAAGCLFFVYILILTNLNTISSLDNLKMKKFHNIIASIFPFIFLVIGSRTTALLAFGYAIALFIPKIKPLYLRNIISTYLLLLGSIALGFATSVPVFVSYINQVSSNRLDVWGSYLEGSVKLGKSASGITSALDNSYLNILFDSSFIGLSVYLIFMSSLFIFLLRKDYVGTLLPSSPRFSPSIFLLFILMAGITDSGLTSPTSINFISAWALLFAILISPQTVARH